MLLCSILNLSKLHHALSSSSAPFSFDFTPKLGSRNWQLADAQIQQIQHIHKYKYTNTQGSRNCKLADALIIQQISMERYCDQQTGSLDKLKNKNWKYITGVSAGRVAKKLERPNIFYIFEKLGSRMSNMTFKYDNPIQFGSSPFNSSPQCKNGDIKGSFRRNFWKLGNNQFWWKVWNSFFKWPVFLGGIFGRKTASDNPLFPPFCPISGHKRVKDNTVMKGCMKALEKTRIFLLLLGVYGRSKF